MSKKVTPNGWSKEVIQQLLETNDKAVCRALVAIYAHQTHQEQLSGTTKEHNGVGFSAFDAEFLSSLAEQVKTRGTLSPRQLELARKKMKSYWRQLLEIAATSRVQYTPPEQKEIDLKCAATPKSSRTAPAACTGISSM